MLKETFLIHISKDGGYIKTEGPFEQYPTNGQIMLAIEKHEGDSGTIEKSFDLIKKEEKKSDDLREALRPMMLMTIKNKLLHAAENHNYIYVDEYLRQVGKTTALIEFAKDIEGIVVVRHRSIAEALKEQSKYDRIMSVFDASVKGFDQDTPVVFDEGVNPDMLIGLNVATGFVNKK
ncbi:hypothetical protein TCA2_4503 [Paenibacillus sp. TCA20]|uniref:Uncharacterized protein n=1 Tax=Paenibacillus urinalis TaxID=521520 RepID=A0ABY7XHA4_9BACL|nr:MULTISPECIES: hypothetical protein [Paenibacillus]WDI05163.1 hypothetical protein PUW25_25480 [Paenibacillus urinalis]GAK42011.1 hypothetical protein TCA2_4503 [Paenibacillus sp. TCA20]